MIAGKNDEFHVPIELTEPREPVRWVDANERQDARQAAVPALYKTTYERLACELALGMEEPEKIFSDYGYTPAQALELTESPAFTALCKRIGSEIRESGLSFKSKMKAVAEDLIPHAYDIATDPLQPATVRQKIIEWAAKMAGFEPAPAKGVEAGGGGFSLSITFAGQAPQQIVTGREPVLIDQPQEV